MSYFSIIKLKNMRFHTRKWVKPEDLNPNGTLFGGKLLAWIDEELALYTIIQLENSRIVTKHMSEINFRSSARQGDIIEIGIDVVKFGRSSIELICEARNMMTRETIITIASTTMVNLGEDGKPKAHGKTEIEYVKDRIG
jgi:acyl-CoA hydrolase